MAKDGQGKKPNLEETLQVRVRSKKPLIERKKSSSAPEKETVMHDAEDIRPRAPRISRPMDDDATEIAHQPPPIPKSDVVVRGSPKRERGTASVYKSTSPKAESPAARAAVPGTRMDVVGTDAAGALAARARVQNAEDALQATRIPALKVLRTELSREALRSLERAFAGELEDRSSRDPAHSPKRTLERLVNSPELNALDLRVQARLLEAVAQEPRDTDSAKAALRLAGSGVIGKLAASDRGVLLDLFAALRTEQRVLLAAASERRQHGGSILGDRDFEDTPLLRHLLDLAGRRGLAPALERSGVRKDQVLSVLLGTLADPARLPLDDGGDGVLGVIEFALAETSPAEYARLWRRLTTDDMVAELPDQGSPASSLREPRTVLGRPSRDVVRASLDLAAVLRGSASLTGGDTPLRLGLEQLAGLARPKGGARRESFVMPGGQGIDADVLARALAFLYGVTFSVAAGAQAVLRAMARAAEDRHRVPPVFATALHDGGERVFVFDHLTGGDVFLRSPHGGSSKRKGARRLDPDRYIEDPHEGVDRIAVDDFREVAGVAILPRT